MPIRFRYLKPGGDEVAVEGLEELRAHILSGAVGEGTLLHDALTDEWTPAGAHSAYELLNQPDADLAALTGGDRPGARAPGPRRPGRADPLSLGEMSLNADFRDISAAPSDAREVIEALLKERAEEAEKHSTEVLRSEPYSNLRTWDDQPRPGPGAPEIPAGEAPLGVDGPPRRDRSWAASGDRSSPRARSRGRVRTAPATSSVPRRPRAPLVRGPVLVWGGVVALAAGAVLFAVLRQSSQAAVVGRADGSFVEVSLAEAPRGGSASDVLGRLAGTEGAAFGDMVEAMDSLRRAYAIERVPPVWLEGQYLADADRYPEVPTYWHRYQRFIDAVREQDTELFRQSLVGRLEAQNVSGPMIAIRLSRAMDEFRASQPERHRMYAHMQDLASTSLALHDLLVERSDDIDFDPVTRSRASREPVLEAYAGDAMLREAMWSLMDRIFEDLESIHGGPPLARDHLTDQLLEGIRATGGI